MYFIFNIFQPNNTGAPDYNICGQGSSVLSMNNTSCTLSVEDEVLFTTTNLLTVNPSTPAAIGSTGLIFESFNRNVVTGAIIIKISGINVYDEKNLTLNLERGGFYSFTNSFKLFGYDLGNESGSSTGNPNIHINLINKTNNTDIYGLQSKTFSKFITYQKPFTNKTLIYNLVGTTGTISYFNTDTLQGIGGGQNASICSTNNLNISQNIIVNNIDCEIYDTCTSDLNTTQSIWFPPVNKSYYNNKNCTTECISNLDLNTFELNLDYSSVSVYKIDGDSVWLFSPDSPSQTLYEQFVFELYDYNGVVIETSTVNVTNFYSVFVSNPSIITPTIFSFNLPVFGEVVAKVKYQILKESDDSVLIECTKIQNFESCNYWKVINGDNCGDFKFLNCSSYEGELNIYQLQDDKTFSLISTVTIDSFSTIDISLASDGVYTYVFQNKDLDTEETYVIFNYCNFKSCYFEYIKKVMCTDICEDCNKKGYYDFNSFSLNAQLFLSLMNSENAFNYFYTAIDTDKIDELYDIKSTMNRLNEYCNKSCGCKTCS